MKVKKNNVKLKKNDEINFISNNKVYRVISIEYDCYRVFNDIGEPALVPNYIFDIVDNSLECDWVIIMDNQDIQHLGPKEFSSNYFFEDFFDGDKSAIKIMLDYIDKKKLKIYCDLSSFPIRGDEN